MNKTKRELMLVGNIFLTQKKIVVEELKNKRDIKHKENKQQMAGINSNLSGITLTLSRSNTPIKRQRLALQIKQHIHLYDIHKRHT